MPVRRSRRHVQSGNVLFLMTGAALLAVLTMPIKPASDVLSVDVIVIALTREVARRVAVETSWMFEHGNYREECSARFCVIFFGDGPCGAGAGGKAGRNQ